MMVCWARSISDLILIVVIFGQNMIPTFEGNEQGIKNVKILRQRKQEISDAMWMSGVNFHLKQKYIRPN